MRPFDTGNTSARNSARPTSLAIRPADHGPSPSPQSRRLPSRGAISLNYPCMKAEEEKPPAAIRAFADPGPVRRISRYLRGSDLGAVLLRGSLGSLALRVAGLGVTFLMGVQLARGLGVEGYGIYGLAISIIALLSVPAEFGLPQLVLREVATASANQNWPQLFGVIRWADKTVAPISALLASLLIGALLLGYGAGTPGFAATLIWGALLVPLVALGRLRGAALRGINHVILGQFPDVLMRPALFALFLAAALLMKVHMTPAYAMSLNVLATALAFALAAFLLQGNMARASSDQALVTYGRTWLLSAFPLALSEGLRICQGSGAVFLLALLGTSTDIGIYVVADRTALVCAVPISLLNVVVAPLLAQFFAEGNNVKIQRAASLVAMAMLGGVLLLSVPLFAAGHSVVECVFGSEYSGAVLPLWLLCAGQLVSAFSGPSAALLTMTGHERCVTRAFAVALLTNLTIAAICIPTLGVAGVALGVLIGSIIWNGILWFDAKRILAVDPSLLSFIPRRSWR